ncbi:MAG: GEVED domain-containing protein, partial [Bacteroidota bacterium]
ATTTSNVYIDDFSITTYPGAQTFNTITLDFQNTNPIGKNTHNNDIIGIRVSTTGAGAGNVGLSVGNFSFLPNGCTLGNPNPVDVSTTKLWWTGGSGSFNPLTATQIGAYAGAMSPSWNISGAGLSGLDNGDNYLWLTYDVPSGAVSNNCVDADFISAVIGGVTRTCGTVGCTLPGCRMIGVAYCAPVYTIGTAGNGSYVNNDYVRWVQCAGDPAYPPGINNDHNDNGPNVAGSGAGDGCTPPGGCAGGPCPFSAHPNDYELFPVTSVPALCNTGTSSRTAVFLESSVAPPTYNINVQCGAWFGNNCIAAWIDFNHDGVFNNNFFYVTGGEKIVQSGYMNTFTFVNANFQVPVTGYYGNTTLRVREAYANSNMDPCATYYYGEAEDYTVTLRPDCSPLYPGWKIWLGYTDEWNTNTNWCGGVPTINDNALIPGKGSQSFNRGAGTYHPVIRSSVLATTKKLVLINDTVGINAPVAGSLRISDSLDIKPNSLLKVDSSFANSVFLSNGLNVSATYSPFRASFKEQKM